MQIVEPKVEYWEQKDPILHVAHCAQVCYQSKPKEKEAAEKFYNALISSGHISMLRHESCYYILSINVLNAIFDYDNDKTNEHYKSISIEQAIGRYSKNPYVQIKYDFDVHKVFIVTNANFILDTPLFKRAVQNYKVTPQEFMKECPELMRFTFYLTTQISTTRELNRCAGDWGISEMSTRYIKFGGRVEPSIVRPWWMSSEDACTWNGCMAKNAVANSLIDKPEMDYLMSCGIAFNSYDKLLSKGVKPENARGVLPLDTLSKVVYTGSLKVWSHVLQLRLLDTTGRAHGNCHVICGLIYDELQKMGYKFNDNNQLVYDSRTSEIGNPEV